MEVILLERVGKLGAVGDVVTVKDGFARNFLIPQGKVLRANAQNKALFQEQKEHIEKENAEKRAIAQQVAEKLDNLVVVLIRQCGEDGRLFGSVSARDIATAVTEASIEIQRENVVLSTAIKTIGVHPIHVSLHPEVAVTVNVNVSRSITEAEEATRVFLKQKSKSVVTAEEIVEVVEEIEVDLDNEAAS